MGAPNPAPAPSGRDGFVPQGAPLFAPPTREGRLSFGRRSPWRPHSPRGGSSGLDLGLRGRWGAGQGAEVGRRAWRAIRPGPPGGFGAILGATPPPPPPQGPPPHCRTRGSRRPGGTSQFFLRRRLAHPLPTSGSRPPAPQARPEKARPAPGRVAGSPGLELGAPGSTCHCGLCSRSRRRALTAASAAAVPLGFVCPRLPARPLPARPPPARRSPHTRQPQTQSEINRPRSPKRSAAEARLLLPRPRPPRTPSRSRQRGLRARPRGVRGVRGAGCGRGGGRGVGGLARSPSPPRAWSCGQARSEGPGASPPPRLARSRVWLRPGTARTLLGGRVLRSARGEGARPEPRPSVASRSIPWGGSAASPAGHLGGGVVPAGSRGDRGVLREPGTWDGGREGPARAQLSLPCGGAGGEVPDTPKFHVLCIGQLWPLPEPSLAAAQRRPPAPRVQAPVPREPHPHPVTRSLDVATQPSPRSALPILIDMCGCPTSGTRGCPKSPPPGFFPRLTP